MQDETERMEQGYEVDTLYADQEYSPMVAGTLEERRDDAPGERRKKRCVKCKRFKWMDEDFWTDNSRPDGRSIYCKACRSDMRRGTPAVSSMPSLAPETTQGTAPKPQVSIHAGWGTRIELPGATGADWKDQLGQEHEQADEVEAGAELDSLPDLLSRGRASLDELVQDGGATFPAVTLDDFLNLEHAPAVWVGPAGVSVMASSNTGPGFTRGAIAYNVLTPGGEGPGFTVDAVMARYLVELLARLRLGVAGVTAPLGVMVYGGR